MYFYHIKTVDNNKIIVNSRFAIPVKSNKKAQEMAKYNHYKLTGQWSNLISLSRKEIN